MQDAGSGGDDDEEDGADGLLIYWIMEFFRGGKGNIQNRFMLFRIFSFS